MTDIVRESQIVRRFLEQLEYEHLNGSKTYEILMQHNEVLWAQIHDKAADAITEAWK